MAWRSASWRSASGLPCGVMSTRPRTTTRRNSSPRRCTAREKRSARSWETVDLPAAITPVTTMTWGMSTAVWRDRSLTDQTLWCRGRNVAGLQVKFKSPRVECPVADVGTCALDVALGRGARCGPSGVRLDLVGGRAPDDHTGPGPDVQTVVVVELGLGADGDGVVGQRSRG